MIFWRLFSLRTLGAYPLNHVINRVHRKAFGEVDCRYVYRLETVGTVATLAVKVRVHIIEGTFIVTIAYFIAQGSAAVFHGMRHMACSKQREHAEYA